jgi:hypothetical protein
MVLDSSHIMVSGADRVFFGAGRVYAVGSRGVLRSEPLARNVVRIEPFTLRFT